MSTKINKNITYDIQIYQINNYLNNSGFLLQNDAEAAREAYTKFLERYPYCYGYWRKFADYEKKKGNPENVQTVSTIMYYIH